MVGALGEVKCSVNVQGVVICKGMMHAENTCRGWCAAGSRVAHGTAEWVRGLERVTVAGCLSLPAGSWRLSVALPYRSIHPSRFVHTPGFGYQVPQGPHWPQGTWAPQSLSFLLCNSLDGAPL